MRRLLAQMYTVMEYKRLLTFALGKRIQFNPPCTNQKNYDWGDNRSSLITQSSPHLPSSTVGYRDTTKN